MRGFEANNCRLCEKVFCCEKCRMKHETNYHKVFPQCDICIYGKFIFDNIDETYLQHLESSHLPLNCVYCKRVFTTIEEILQHKKCPIPQPKEDSPKTPFRHGTPSILVSTDDQDSPILQESQRKEALNYIFNLATSTPMQSGEEPNIIFGKSKESITPVDKHSQLINKSIIKKTDSMKADNSSKRRVTFGETPSTANRNREDTKHILTHDEEISNKKNADTNHTPVTGSSTGQFYSAKSEVEQFSSAKTDISNIVRENRSRQLASEAFTPVCVPNKSKITNMKEENRQNPVSNNLSVRNSNLLSPDEHKTQDSNLNEVSMEICTPAKISEPTVKEIVGSAAITTEDPSDFSEQRCSNESKLPTRACSLDPGKILAKGAAYESLEKVSEQESQISSTSQEKQVDRIDGETSPRIAQPDITNANNCNTLWLSAINLNDSNDSDIENKERDDNEDKKSDSPPKPERRRVSVVMPTPILKKTNVKMKFHIPAHFSSTPIVSSGIVKLKQTRIVEEIPARVLSQQTPFKTPQGKLSEFAECNFIRANSHESFFDNETDSDKSENSPDKNGNPRDFTTYHSDVGNGLCKGHVSSTSVSSMTESSLWTSMTRIVKSVLGGFTNMNQDSNICINRGSNSSKRQLSDADSDFLEAPRLKRFKFTDIKCRRPIRNLPALMERPTLSAPTNQVATFEIVRSVSTLYGGTRMRIQCDKATQTDDYLMYGWHPKA